MAFFYACPAPVQVEEEVLRKYENDLLQKEHSGCAALLRDDKVRGEFVQRSTAARYGLNLQVVRAHAHAHTFSLFALLPCRLTTWRAYTACSVASPRSSIKMLLFPLLSADR
jgi:hypothetical protein